MPNPTDPAPSSLATQLADAAAAAIGRAVETRYVHQEPPNTSAGVFDTDCSGFVTWLVRQLAPRHLEAIEDSMVGDRPLARDFYEFAAALPLSIGDGWRQIATLDSVRRGDIVAWSRPEELKGDTGHVFVAAGPVPDGGGQSVNVYDSSDVRHYDDSRGPGKPFATGVGTGAIHFETDDAGRPVAVRFNDGERFADHPIAIARIEPFLAR